MYNKCILVGNVGADIESQTNQNGFMFGTFRLATDDKSGMTTWHNCKIFGKYGESVSKYITKGKKVFVEGKLSYHHWEKDGHKFTKSEILVDKILFLSHDKDLKPMISDVMDEPFDENAPPF